MAEKLCTKCKGVKPHDSFSPDKRVKNGLTSWCRSCLSENQKKWRATPRGKQLSNSAALRRYYSQRGQEYIKQYNQTESRKQVVQRYKRSEKGKKAAKRYYQKINRRAKARHKISYAVESGVMPPVNTLDCSRCGAKADNYHHHKGYDKKYWADVVPLCDRCHADVHTTPSPVLTSAH